MCDDFVYMAGPRNPGWDKINEESGLLASLSASTFPPALRPVCLRRSFYKCLRIYYLDLLDLFTSRTIPTRRLRTPQTRSFLSYIRGLKRFQVSCLPLSEDEGAQAKGASN